MKGVLLGEEEDEKSSEESMGFFFHPAPCVAGLFVLAVTAVPLLLFVLFVKEYGCKVVVVVLFVVAVTVVGVCVTASGGTTSGVEEG